MGEKKVIIQTENLTKHYGKSRGIIDIDLGVESKEVFGFLGPNGGANRPQFARCSISSGPAPDAP